MVDDDYTVDWDTCQAGPYPNKADFTTIEDYLVAKLMWQTEMCLGPISTRVCENAGDDDRSVLEHNFACIIREALQN